MLPATYFRRMDAWKGGGCVTAATTRATQGAARGLMTGRADSVSEWISVKDRLPEPSKKVLCFLDLGHGSLVETGYFMLDDGWYYTGVEAPHHGCVTYWMPLPEPPKED